MKNLALIAFLGCTLFVLRCSLPTKEIPPLTVSKETTYITGPLMADGAPDYAAALNEKYGAGATPENNAAILLIPVFWNELEDDILKLMGAEPDPLPQGSRLVGRLAGRTILSSDEERRRIEDGPCSEKQCPVIAEWLKTHEKPLALIAEGVQKPRYWVPFKEGVNLWDSPRSRLLSFTNAGAAFRARAMLKLSSGDWAGAAQDILTCQRLATTVGAGPMLIDGLVSVSVRGIASEAVSVLAASPALTAKGAKELLHALHELPDPWTVADSQLHSRFESLAGVIALRRAGFEKGSGAWKEMLERAGIRMPSGLYQVEPSLSIGTRRFAS